MNAIPGKQGAHANVHPIIPWLTGLVALLALPLLMRNNYHQYVVNIICINIILAVGLNIVKGFAGQVTVGHVALAAIGAYSSAMLSSWLGFPFWIALPSAMLITGAAGILIGIPAMGFESIPPPRFFGTVLDSHPAYFYVVMPAAWLAVFFSFAILRSDIGRAFKAIREDQLAAAASGVNVRKYKLIAFILSALYAGCAGSL